MSRFQTEFGVWPETWIMNNLWADRTVRAADGSNRAEEVIHYYYDEAKTMLAAKWDSIGYDTWYENGEPYRR